MAFSTPLMEGGSASQSELLRPKGMSSVQWACLNDPTGSQAFRMTPNPPIPERYPFRKHPQLLRVPPSIMQLTNLVFFFCL